MIHYLSSFSWLIQILSSLLTSIKAQSSGQKLNKSWIGEFLDWDFFGHLITLQEDKSWTNFRLLVIQSMSQFCP